MQCVTGLPILRCMKNQYGFNILELMAAVAILGILLGYGVPGLQAFIQDNRLTSQINLLSTSLALARSEAIKLNQRVVVCVSSDGAQCEPLASGTTWNAGWIVFVDRNGTGDVDVGAPGTDDCAADSTTDCILATQAAFSGTNVLTPEATVLDLITFTSDGAIQCNTDGDASVDDTSPEPCVNATNFFTLCDFRGDAHAKALFISRTGRVSILDKQPDGSALTCS